jgi:hypothetical protein
LTTHAVRPRDSRHTHSTFELLRDFRSMLRRERGRAPHTFAFRFRRRYTGICALDEEIAPGFRNGG